jgi:hypothetical protein
MNGADAASIAVALAASLSPNTSLREPAAAQLASWERVPEYWPALLSVVAARNQLDVGVRQAAAVQYKNGCERFWRKSAQKSVSPLAATRCARSTVADL